MEFQTPIERENVVSEAHDLIQEKSPASKQRSVKNGRPPIEPHRLEKQPSPVLQEKVVEVLNGDLNVRHRAMKDKPNVKHRPVKKRSPTQEGRSLKPSPPPAAQEEFTALHEPESGNFQK